VTLAWVAHLLDLRHLPAGCLPLPPARRAARSRLRPPTATTPCARATS